MKLYHFFLTLLLVSFTAPAASAEPLTTDHPQASPFGDAAAAHDAVDAALERARNLDKRLILVFGANWCHDSRSLSGWFTQPRFAEMLAAKYEIAYVNVCEPQVGNGCNIDIARRFGVKKIKGTPTVLVLSPQGRLLNRKSAPQWRDAASRNADDIYAYFDQFPPE